ncbi:MAG: type II secretion system protein [Lachnospiraceae bacterium]|nr:type II secretion system protein [Lachnospiraceae bacterium]
MRRNKGFSLIELIVVIAIMAVLVGLLVPNVTRYVEKNRAKACRVNREEILGIFERCVYAESVELTQADLVNVASGGKAENSAEVLQYKECPSDKASTVYTATLVDGIAMITCNHADHDPVVIDLSQWEGTELAEGIDPTLVPPSASPTPTATPTPSDTPTPTPTPDSYSDGYWPSDDARWDGTGKQPGSIVTVKVPSGLQRSNNGFYYVLVNRSGTGDADGTFNIYYEWRAGPEVIDTRKWEQVVSWSGVKYTDWKAVQHPDGSQNVTGIRYGDMLEYEGKLYIYNHYPNDNEIWQPLPNGHNGGNNWYYVNSGGALESTD